MLSLAAEPLSSNAPEAHARPPFSDVTEGLARIDERGPELLSSAALRDDLKWFATQQRALEAMSARWLAELDRRDPEGPEDLLTSCRRWLCDELKLTSNAAYSHIRTARALDETLHLTAGALRRGEISAHTS